MTPSRPLPDPVPDRVPLTVWPMPPGGPHGPGLAARLVSAFSHPDELVASRFPDPGAAGYRHLDTVTGQLDRRHARLDDPLPAGLPAGVAGLIVDADPAPAGPPDGVAAVLARYAGLARLLAAGGNLLSVHTRRLAGPVDPLAGTIAAARAAGLAYTAHLVVLTVPVRDSHLTHPHPESDPDCGRGGVGVVPVPLRRVHTDLLVLRHDQGGAHA